MNELKHLFLITFVVEDRYLYFLNGLGITLLLTFSSFLLGTALGVALCAGMRSGNAAVRRVAGIIKSFFVQLPTMVLLMIMVYVIFGHSALPILAIVIVGLTLKAASYLAEIFDAALSTVQPGEIEAARTLGMTRWQAFRFVALPQTVAAALPLYQNQFVATMQETSVVGYLAVIDLTRASSIVSSRTLDAFVGLFTITVIYFLIGAAVRGLFHLATVRMRKGGEGA